MAKDPVTGEEITEVDPEETGKEALKEEPASKAEVARLRAKNAELERLLNLENRVTGVEQRTQQPTKEPMNDKQKAWIDHLKPLVTPMIEEAVTPYKHVIFQLADELDRTQALAEYPELRDPEVQQRVEETRQLMQKRTNSPVSRKDAVIYVRGQEPDFVNERRKRQEDESAKSVAQRAAAFVNTAPPMGATGPRFKSSKPFADMTVEEQEKFLNEGNGGKPVNF